MQTIVMVTGASPGLGKTTLAVALADGLEARGWHASRFLESEIGDRAEFADVMASFRSTGVASAQQLLDASAAYLTGLRASECDVVVQDMLFPYLPSLLAWGHSDADILQFLGDLADRCVGGQRLVQVHLDGDPRASLPRAIEREDDGWLGWMVSKVSGYADQPSPVSDLDSLLSYFAHARARTAALLRAAPWPVVILHAGDGPQAVADAALAAVRPHLA